MYTIIIVMKNSRALRFWRSIPRNSYKYCHFRVDHYLHIVSRDNLTKLAYDDIVNTISDFSFRERRK